MREGRFDSLVKKFAMRRLSFVPGTAQAMAFFREFTAMTTVLDALAKVDVPSINLSAASIVSFALMAVRNLVFHWA
jgi:hypothetical protein